MLRRQLAELRPGDGLGGVQAELHVLGEIPGQRRRRQPIFILDPGRDDIGAAQAEQVDRRHRLLSVLEADARLEPEGRHQLGFHLAIGAEHLEIGLVGGHAGRARHVGEDDVPGVDVIVGQEEVRPLLRH